MSELPPEALSRIIAELKFGGKLDAVKIYREATGASLMTSKKEVEALQERLKRGTLDDPLLGNAESQAEYEGDLPADALYQIIQQLRDDRLLHAIKIYKDAMGSSLLEAKQEVELLREKLRRGELAEPGGDFNTAPEAPYLPPSAMNDIVAALRDQRLIDAVKVYREVMHCSLADAKREVEQIRDQLESGGFDDDTKGLEIRSPDNSATPEVYSPPAIDKSSGCFGVALLLLVCCGAIALVIVI